jgi:hypothetical protein
MFQGMRGTGDWVTDERPKNWREMVHYLYPNGSAPLVALTSKMKSQKVDDPEYYWWTQEIASVGGTVSGVYTEPTLTTLYTSSGVAGNVLYLKVTAALAARVREGHQLLLRDASDYTVDVNVKVISVVVNGASSILGVRLLEDDDNSTSHDLSDCDTFLIVGNINAEGAEMPDAVALNPTKVYNRTQIFRSPLSLTRTAMATKLRTGDAYQRAKRECLEMHSIEMELAFIWGVMTENTGSNGKPERTTMGLVECIKQYAATNVSDYSLSAAYSGLDWTAAGGGELWLDTMLEQIFRYGATSKLVFAGSGALLGLNRLAKSSGSIQLTPSSNAYGMQVVKWLTPFGNIDIKTHPLFSYDSTTRNMMLIFEPSELTYRFIDDTTFFGEGGKTASTGTGARRIDGINEEYLTEAGLEFIHPKKCGILNGVGIDNDLS